MTFMVFGIRNPQILGTWTLWDLFRMDRPCYGTELVGGPRPGERPQHRLKGVALTRVQTMGLSHGPLI